MNLNVTQEILDEVNWFINQHLVDNMNEVNMSYQSMAFILHTLIVAVDDEQERLDKEEKM